MSKIEVSAEEFMHCHASLVRLLTVISTSESKPAGGGGISTRQLCDQSFNSRNYGTRMIKEAEKNGYIRRVKTGKKTIHTLTSKGRRLLQKLEKAGAPQARKLKSS
jgi:DNA-binding MarR family transcriptional regulator